MHAASISDPSPQRDPAAIRGLDRRILARLARDAGAVVALDEFAWAVTALDAIVRDLIPAGSVFFLAEHRGAPIFGSLISGVGITRGPEGVVVARVSASGEVCVVALLRAFAP